MKKRIVQILQSKSFKQVTFILGILFLVLTAFISLKPEPFLRFGYIGVFIFNLFGAGTLLVLPLARYMNVVLLAFTSALGMAFNDSIAWLIGNSGEVIIPKSKKLQRIEYTVEKYGVFALFFWSLIPIPYDLVGFIAGYLGLSYKKYIIPTFLGKFIRLILLGAGIISVFGKI